MPAAGLVDVAELDGLADLHRAAVRLLEPDDGLEQRGLADAVGADDADDAVARQRERQVLDQHPAVEALVQVLDLDHDAAQPRARRDLDLLEVELAGLLGLGGHLLVALQPRLALGLAGLGAGADPGELVLQPLLQLGVLAALHRRAARPSSPGRWSSCPRTGRRGRGPARGSTRRRCPGSSGRG